MFLDTVLPLGLFGILIGFLSSFLGVGGGCLMVPVMGLIFVGHGTSPDIAQRMALGTSLAVTVLVNGTTVLEHMRHGSMRWDRWRLMFFFVIAGSFCGSHLANAFSALTLKIFYACFVCAMSYTMFHMPKLRPLGHAHLVLPCVGFLIGIISGLVGVAGSLVCIVFLATTGLDWFAAVCTGSALGLPICIAAVAGFIHSGQGIAGIPEWCVGYLNLPALFSISIPGIIATAIGSKICYTARNLPIDFLRKVYSVLAAILALSNVFL